MANMKRVSISDKCTLCGLCEQDGLSKVFQLDSDIYQMRPLNNGLFDLDKYPMIMEVCSDCPAGAITVEDEQMVAGSKAEILDKLNQMIYHDLRDFPFDPPDESKYEYSTGKYHASKIPAQYRSTAKYHSDDSAEKAGVAEFKRSVWNQYKAIARQYITEYKVKKLKPYFSYEEHESNYYYALNLKIEGLLDEVSRLAQVATDGKISLPSDFGRFSVMPRLKDADDSLGYLYGYQILEDFQFNYEGSSFFHNADYYDSWVNTDGDDRYYYDFEEAEEQFRDDMYYVVEEVINSIAKQRVEEITEDYHKAAKRALAAKMDILQRELKKHIKVDEADVFKQQMRAVYQEILDTPIPEFKAPFCEIDTNVNSDYRFYSERSRDEAADHRRERAYNDGRGFIVHTLPRELNENLAKALGATLTSWKRSILRAYDMSGKPHPSKRLLISYDGSEAPSWEEASGPDHTGFGLWMGNRHITISLSGFDEVKVEADNKVRQFIDSDLLHHGTSVNGVSYISEYSVKITYDSDYDLKETLFGGLKEVNHRYAYNIYQIRDFQYSARDVANECAKALRESSFLQNYFDRIKRDIISGLKKETGIS